MATTVITNYQAIASTIAAMGGTSGLIALALNRPGSTRIAF